MVKPGKSIYDDNLKQKKAKKRAREWLKTLFIDNEDDPDPTTPINTHFAAIMKAVDPIPNSGEFTLACRNAGLDESEIRWLWEYLKNCNSAIYSSIPEAATSGW